MNHAKMLLIRDHKTLIVVFLRTEPCCSFLGGNHCFGKRNNNNFGCRNEESVIILPDV